MKRSYLLAAALFAVMADLQSAVIRVPVDMPTIQSAIQAALSGDTVQIAAGRYREKLSIKKSVTLIGAGADSCTIYRNVPSTDSAIVMIENAIVGMTGLEINGGDWNESLAYYAGFSPKGLWAKSSQVSLTGVVVNQILNYMIIIEGGKLDANRVELFTRLFAMQCDIGIELLHCEARITELRQASDTIDHTVDVNGDAKTGLATVTVENCEIRASGLSWGNCVRTFSDANLKVEYCNLYRLGGEPVGQLEHSGVAVSGYQVNAMIRNNAFTGLPRGIFAYGSLLNSNRIVVEHNAFSKCTNEAVFISNMNYEGIDLGGGAFASEGDNTFTNSGKNDVTMFSSNHDVSAKYNWWTAQNPDDKIWDRTDDASLGKVLYRSSPAIPTLMTPPDGASDVPINTDLLWLPAGGAAGYGVQVSKTGAFQTLVYEQTDLTAAQCTLNSLEPYTLYYWRVNAQNAHGTSSWSNAFSFTTGSTNSDVRDAGPELPGELDLGPVYPNPFNQQVQIVFWVARTERVSLTIFDVFGRKVDVLTDKTMLPGRHQTQWDARHAPSGMVFCRMQAGKYVKTIKLNLIK